MVSFVCNAREKFSENIKLLGRIGEHLILWCKIACNTKRLNTCNLMEKLKFSWRKIWGENLRDNFPKIRSTYYWRSHWFIEPGVCLRLTSSWVYSLNTIIFCYWSNGSKGRRLISLSSTSNPLKCLLQITRITVRVGCFLTKIN